jgi:citrate lyase beta subunit
VKTSLAAPLVADLTRRLRDVSRALAQSFPGEAPRRQPVHTVYGGAQLFRRDSAAKLGALARRSLDEHGGSASAFAAAVGFDAGLADTLYRRVREKLEREPVEDFRIDFEDGYGNRPDAEEDGHAVSAAHEVAAGRDAGTLPPFIGIRIKPFSEELAARSIRTLDLFLTALGELPENFVVTLPKIQAREQVEALADIFDALEPSLGLARGALRLELMIETTQSIFASDGAVNVRRLVDAARGRCVAAHFGTYDYTASCSITAAHQHMAHPSCDFARHVQQVALAGTGVWLSDGATNILPVAPHVHSAWRLHFQHVRRSLEHAYYQGWDLHPAQLPTRYAAVYSFFLESIEAASERLRNFLSKAAQATLVGDVFDDAATGQGLLNYFLRAINCGAVGEAEALERTGLTLEELRTRSFLAILKRRRELS